MTINIYPCYDSKFRQQADKIKQRKVQDKNFKKHKEGQMIKCKIR